MKTIYSPNLVPGEDTITVCLFAHAPLRFARGGLAHAAEAVRRAGRFGDNLLVHINEREFAQLKRAWGEPHFNPETGLPEYFDWLGLAKSAIPLVTGLFSKKAAIDQANANPAPPTDPNLSTHLGNFTNNRQRIPQPAAPANSFYTYGQKGGETPFYKNNSLANITGQYGPQVQPNRQSTPSTGSMIASTLGGTALDYALKHPDDVASWFGKGPKGKPASENIPDAMKPTPENPFGAAAVDAGAAAIPAIPALGADAAKAGQVIVEDMPGSYAADAVTGYGGAADAGAAGMPGGMGGGAGGAWQSYLAGQGAGGAGGAAGAGAAAYGATPVTGELADLTGSAGSNVAGLEGVGSNIANGALGSSTGATLAGLGTGLGALGAWYLGARALAGTGKMSDSDWVKKLTGNYATASDQYNAAMKSGNTDAAFQTATTMGEAAWAAATHYQAMGDAANAAKYLNIYKNLTANGSWYRQQLTNRSGGANSGQHGSMTSKLLARGGLAMTEEPPLPPAAMSPTQMSLYVPRPGINGNMFVKPPPTRGRTRFDTGGLAQAPMSGAPGVGQPQLGSPMQGNVFQRTMPGVEYSQGQGLGDPMNWSYNGQSGIVGGSGPQPPMMPGGFWKGPGAIQGGGPQGNYGAGQVPGNRDLAPSERAPSPEQVAQQQAQQKALSDYRAQNPNSGLGGMMQFLNQQKNVAGSPFSQLSGGNTGFMVQSNPLQGNYGADSQPTGMGLDADMRALRLKNEQDGTAPPWLTLNRDQQMAQQQQQIAAQRSAQPTGPTLQSNPNMASYGAGQVPGQPPNATTGQGMDEGAAGIGGAFRPPAPSMGGLGQTNPAPPPMSGAPFPNRVPSPTPNPGPWGMGRWGRMGGSAMGRGMGRSWSGNLFRASGGHVSGPGTGRSDDIPARLSDGEYVWDSESVSLLGDGSTKAGAAKLDAMRANLRKHKGAALSKGKFTPAAKPPEGYLDA